ncbi:MAG: hypothetical protein ABEJ05_07105 [Haloglomus sp.]
MSTNHQNESGEQRTNDGSAAADAERPDGQPRLSSTLVRYDGEPDRVTVYPPDTSSIERMSRWITVDLDDCLDLDEVR